MLKRAGKALTDFTFLFIRRRTQRKIATGFQYGDTPVPGINAILGQFTPRGLEQLIGSGQSFVDLWLSVIPRHLHNRALLDLEKIDIDAAAIARAIDWGQVLQEVAKALPEQAKVVARYPEWYARECRRATGTFVKEAVRARPR